MISADICRISEFSYSQFLGSASAPKISYGSGPRMKQIGGGGTKYSEISTSVTTEPSETWVFLSTPLFLFVWHPPPPRHLTSWFWTAVNENSHVFTVKHWDISPLKTSQRYRPAHGSMSPQYFFGSDSHLTSYNLRCGTYSECLLCECANTHTADFLQIFATDVQQRATEGCVMIEEQSSVAAEIFTVKLGASSVKSQGLWWVQTKEGAAPDKAHKSPQIQCCGDLLVASLDLR